MINNETFSVYIKYVILSTDIKNRGKYVLSMEKDNISLPTTKCVKSNFVNLKETILEHFKNLVLINPMEMMPRLISVQSEFLPEAKNQDGIYIVYGFLISKSDSLNNCYWYEFDYMKPTPYSNLLFEVIQNL